MHALGAAYVLGRVVEWPGIAAQLIAQRPHAIHGAIPLAGLLAWVVQAHAVTADKHGAAI